MEDSLNRTAKADEERSRPWGREIIRRDPCPFGAGSWIRVLGTFEMILLDVSDMPFLRVFPAPPTLVHYLLHVAPTPCQVPWGTH